MQVLSIIIELNSISGYLLETSAHVSKNSPSPNFLLILRNFNFLKMRSNH